MNVASPKRTRQKLLSTIVTVKEVLSSRKRNPTTFQTLCRRTDLLIYWASKLAKEDPLAFGDDKGDYRTSLLASATALELWCRELVRDGNRSSSYTDRTRELGRAAYYMNRYLLPWLVILEDPQSMASVMDLALNELALNFPKPKPNDRHRKYYLRNLKELLRWADDLGVKYDKGKLQYLFIEGPDVFFV